MDEIDSVHAQFAQDFESYLPVKLLEYGDVTF